MNKIKYTKNGKIFPNNCFLHNISAKNLSTYSDQNLFLVFLEDDDPDTDIWYFQVKYFSERLAPFVLSKHVDLLKRKHKSDVST